MHLNAEEIAILDELRFDDEAIEATLKLALNYHANKRGELAKRANIFWKKLGEKYGFHPENGYSIRTENGFVSIVKMERPDEQGEEAI